MARPAMTLSRGGEIAEHLSIGLLARALPRDRIEEALRCTGAESQRVRALPHDVVVYYVVALGLFMSVSTREVMRCLMQGLDWLEGGAGGGGAGGEAASPRAIPVKSALAQARARVGVAPLRWLVDRLLVPLGTEQTPGCFYRGWRQMALDCSTLDVPDTAANRAHFGKQATSRGTMAFPQLRLSALVETGTHAILAAHMAPMSTGEHTLAAALLPRMSPGMLVLADRGFSLYDTWKKAAATGADLLWRTRINALLPVEKRLPDGSYLSTLRPGAKTRRLREGAPVRVIEYRLTATATPGTTYRLITTILDPAAAPADELAALYAGRWEIESVFDELKTHLRGNRIVLRSKTPLLIEQEFLGLILAHYAVRQLMTDAAQHAGHDPDRLSFVHTLRVIRRRLIMSPFSPSGQDPA